MAGIIKPKEAGLSGISGVTAGFLANVTRGPEAPRFILGFDATVSRKATFEAAIPLQVDLINEYSTFGGVRPQFRLSCFLGDDTFLTTPWVDDGRRLEGPMRRVVCESGKTQIGKVLTDAEIQTGGKRVTALLYVGDMMEENLPLLVTQATRLGAKRTPVYIFQEGDHADSAAAFSVIAKASGGKHLKFGPGNYGALKDEMRVVMAEAANNAEMLAGLREDKMLSPAARALLGPGRR